MTPVTHPETDETIYDPQDPANHAFWVDWLAKDFSAAIDRARADGLPDNTPVMAIIDALFMTAGKVIETNGNQLCEQEIVSAYCTFCSDKVTRTPTNSDDSETDFDDVPF